MGQTTTNLDNNQSEKDPSYRRAAMQTYQIYDFWRVTWQMSIIGARKSNNFPVVECYMTTARILIANAFLPSKLPVSIYLKC